jgi:hypothetical protein
MEMKCNKVSYSAIQNYTAAALAFYKINDVIVDIAILGRLLQNINELERREPVLMRRYQNI